MPNANTPAEKLATAAAADTQLLRTVVRHDDDCLLTNENLGALIRRSYGKVKRNWWSRGVWDAAS